MKYLVTLLLWGLLIFISFSQNIDHLEDNLDLQSKAEGLENNNWNYSGYPKDINQITEEELEYLNLLSHSQIESFLRYRRFMRNIYTIYELLDVPGIDVHTFYKLAPFVKSSFSPKLETREYFIIQTSRFLNTTESHFPSLFKYHHQLRLKRVINSKMSFGISLDSDIGESINFNKQRGTNHSVSYLEIKKSFYLNKIIIGNFNNHYGQGLMFSNQFFNGKSSKSIYNSYFNSDETTPYKSMGESGFLQGVSIYKRIKNIRVYAWFSSLNIHGTLTDDTLSSIYNTGYFRNNKEYLKRNVSKEQAFGGRLSFKFLHNKIKLGFSGSKFNYSTPVQLYYMKKSNTTFTNLGIDYLIRTKYISFFGELVNQNTNNIQLHGFQSNVDDNTRFSLIYRNYSPEYFNQRANGFSTYSNNRNEEGLYLSVNHKLNRMIEFFSYIDRYRHLVPGYGKNLATKNTSWILGTNFLLDHGQRILFAYKQDILGTEVVENKLPQESSSSYNHIFISHKYQKKQTKISTNLQLKSSHSKESINFGQYFTHKLKTVQITLGYNIFNAEESDLRLYQYQPDITFNNSFNALSGNGSQFYGIGKFKITKRLILSSKVSLTTYSDKEKITKGLETIDNNKVWEGKLQVFYKL